MDWLTRLVELIVHSLYRCALVAFAAFWLVGMVMLLLAWLAARGVFR